MYFKTVPKIRYPWTDDKGNIRTAIMPDIFRRVQLDKFFENRMLLNDYFITDGETPEIVAHKIYGNVEYHWVVLIANNIVDVEREWPLASRDLVKYVKDKYGENNSSDVHHYVDSTNKDLIVDWDAGKLASSEITEITNYNYELDKNEKKRQIFLLDKRYLRDLIQQYKNLVG